MPDPTSAPEPPPATDPGTIFTLPNGYRPATDPIDAVRRVREQLAAAPMRPPSPAVVHPGALTTLGLTAHLEYDDDAGRLVLDRYADGAVREAIEVRARLEDAALRDAVVHELRRLGFNVTPPETPRA